MGVLNRDVLVRTRPSARRHHLLRPWALGMWRGCAIFSLFILSVVLGTGCDSSEGGPGVYPASGTVEDVDVDNAQVLIEHGDIEGLMPAMTMNFAVPDAAVLARLSPGQVIDFELRFTGRSYEVEDFVVVGEAPAADGWRRLRDGLVRSSPAPAFDLIDHVGHPVDLASLGDLVLLVDFIYTECPGPCPVQTSNQVALQRRIPERLREHVRFVSISLDPETDTPEALTRYAEARGADLSHWSFLTGPPDHVAAVVRSWGVGSVRNADGSVDHTLITFLVHEGRVMQRYTARAGGDDELLADLIALAERRASGHAAPADEVGLADPAPSAPAATN